MNRCRGGLSCDNIGRSGHWLSTTCATFLSSFVTLCFPAQTLCLKAPHYLRIFLAAVSDWLPTVPFYLFLSNSCPSVRPKPPSCLLPHVTSLVTLPISSSSESRTLCLLTSCLITTVSLMRMGALCDQR